MFHRLQFTGKLSGFFQSVLEGFLDENELLGIGGLGMGGRVPELILDTAAGIGIGSRRKSEVEDPICIDDLGASEHRFEFIGSSCRTIVCGEELP